MHQRDLEARRRKNETASHPSAPTLEGSLVGRVGTMPELLQRRIEETPDRIAYRQFDRREGQWRSFRWSDVGQLVARWRSALVAERLAPGDRIGVLLPNGLNWVCCDQAALALGAVVTPLYMTDSPSNWAYQLDHADVRLIVIERDEQWRRIAELAPKPPSLTRVVITDPRSAGGSDDPRLASLSAWLPPAADPAPPIKLDPNDLATIIYTSGTTGPAKGVMLSHRNMLAAVESVLKVVPVHADDVFLSYLPLAHVFERIMGYYLPMAVSAEVAFARSIKTLPEDLQTVRPTIMLGVPRIYERIYAAVHKKFGRFRLTRAFLSWAERMGWRAFEAEQGRRSRLSPWRRLLARLVRILIARPIRARLGGRIRVLVSGGAHLPEKVGRFMVALGLPLLEGYGLTESAAPVTGNVFADNAIGTVGRPLPGVETRIAENGELLVRAPSVMLGYWKAPKLTRASLTPDGWLHTGDLGEIVDGRIILRGRLKELLVTSIGEKVAPMPVETTIALDPAVDQVLVVGEDRPFLGAIIVLNPEAWRDLARSLNLDPDQTPSLASKAAKDAILARLDGLLAAFPKHAQIRAVHLTLEPWTVENGLLTTTQKVRRRAVQARFGEAIKDLYRGHQLEA